MWGGVKRFNVVFFSIVSHDKGIDIVLDAAKIIPNIEFHIYGEILDGYKDDFIGHVVECPNVLYHGVFRGTRNEVYGELAKYDALLLPTRWKNEGVPGILVESKIAGIPAIVSNVCYNAEIIKDGVSGVVLNDNTAEALTEAIKKLNNDSAYLDILKHGSRESAEYYYIDNYTNEIINQING